MEIANPIYDVIFKYLMDDVESAKTIISTILGIEINELLPLPQEQAIHSDSKKLTTIRVDFMAIIRLKDGTLKKVLIEMQKAKNPTDVMRFRRYLGENYIKYDHIKDLDPIPLPIICIYFIGYKVNLKNSVVYNKVSFHDMLNGDVVQSSEEIMELLTHETCFIFIDNLSEEEQNHGLNALLTIFDQQNVKSDDLQYILESDIFDNINEPALKKLIMKLHTATLEAELLHKAKLENDFNRDLDIAFGKLTRETELERKLKEEERKLKEEAILQKEEAIFQKEEAIKLLYKNGIDPSVIASSLSIDLSEVLNIVK